LQEDDSLKKTRKSYNNTAIHTCNQSKADSKEQKR